MLRWLPEKGATLIGGAKYIEVTDKGLVIQNKEGQRQLIEADTIATALPLKPNTALLKSLEDKVSEVFAIGDSNNPRLIIHAIADGYRVANEI